MRAAAGARGRRAVITFDGRRDPRPAGHDGRCGPDRGGSHHLPANPRRRPPRGLFCGMGVCQDCLVEIDGRPNQRACMTRIEGPLAVRSQGFPPRLAAGQCDDASPAGARDGRGARGRRRCGRPHRCRRRRRGGRRGGAGGRAAGAGWPVLQAAARRAALPDDPQFAGGRRLIERARAAGVTVRAGCRVDRLAAAAGGGPRTRQARRTFRPRQLIVATGAFERALPVPGWTLPGVMTTGAAQTLLRSYGVSPGRRVLVAGNGPLNLQVACELRRAGAEVVAVAEAARRPGLWAWRPVATMASSGPSSLRARAWLSARAARATGCPCTGARRWPQSSQARPGLCATVSATVPAIAVDVVTMGYGFLPANELLRLLGCRHRHDPARGQLVTERDADCRTSVPGVLAVGDCCGLGGALAAEAEGVHRRRGRRRVRPATAEVARARAALARQRRFQAGLWRLFAAPRLGLALARPDTIVCRCEEVTLATIDAAIADGAGSLGRDQARHPLRHGPLPGALLRAAAGRASARSAWAGRWTSSRSSPRARRSSPCRSAPSPAWRQHARACRH